jgi:hypothetical protein
MVVGFITTSAIRFVVCCNKNNTMGATCGAETAYPYRVPEFARVWILVLGGFVLFMLSHYNKILRND